MLSIFNFPFSIFHFQFFPSRREGATSFETALFKCGFFVHGNRNKVSLQQRHASCVFILSGLDSIEVNPARKIGCVKTHQISSRFFVFIYQSYYFFAKYIIDSYCHKVVLRQIIPYICNRIKRVGVVLRKREFLSCGIMTSLPAADKRSDSHSLLCRNESPDTTRKTPFEPKLFPCFRLCADQFFTSLPQASLLLQMYRLS